MRFIVLIWLIAKIAKVTMLNTINKGSADSGEGISMRGKTAFANKPTNITNTILKLTDRKISTVRLRFLTPIARIMTKPGIKVR